MCWELDFSCSSAFSWVHVREGAGNVEGLIILCLTTSAMCVQLYKPEKALTPTRKMLGAAVNERRRSRALE